VDTNVSDEHTASIFQIKMSRLRIQWIVQAWCKEGGENLIHRKGRGCALKPEPIERVKGGNLSN
jgi:hypothetical protein